MQQTFKNNFYTGLRIFLAIAICTCAFLFMRFQARLIGVDSFGFALFVNLILMALFAFLIGILKPNLSMAYFEPKRFEQKGNIYRKVGLRYFLLMLRFIGSERLRRSSSPVKKDLDALARFEHQTRISEASHALAAVSAFAISIYVGMEYKLDAIIWLLVCNILLNLYPVMLQRYNRPRIQKLVQTLKRQSPRPQL